MTRVQDLEVSQATIRTAIILIDQEIEHWEWDGNLDIVRALQHVKDVLIRVWRLNG